MRLGAYTLVSICALASACSAAGDGTGAVDDFDTVDNAIVNATGDGGPDQAVMVYVKFNNNGSIGTRTCSGTYIASRVVLTAAHCLDGAWDNQIHVYYGDNFAEDYAAVADGGGFVVAPPPGDPSTFARADSFEIHPEWDPALVHPDMGVVYLDRKLPFAPMPLARFRIEGKLLNKEATFSGWGGDTVLGPVDATGAQVQRSGTTKLLGSPTAADYHEDDPNPGMLNPLVRSHVLKTDGRAPYSNGCFGDSGGPLFVKVFGQSFVAGVNYWTGLSCADYNLYTRIDPFLPFLDRAAKRGGREALEPTFQCVATNNDGSYTAYFGYDNKNGVSLSVPHGQRNRSALDVESNRPTEFAPGEHSFQFAVNFTGMQTVSYTLGNDGGHPSTIRANKHSKACGPEHADQIECVAVCESQFDSGCDVSKSFDYCMGNCLSTVSFFGEVFPDCKDEYSAYNACVASTPSGAENWYCDPDVIAYSLMCGEQEMGIYSCMGY